MSQKARAFDALCEAIRSASDIDGWHGVNAAQAEYDRVLREQALNDLDEEYSVIRAALSDCQTDAAAAHLILRWCEDVNTHVLTR